MPAGPKRPAPPDVRAEQLVQPYEVVDVRVGDEDVANAQHRARAERVEIAQVERHRPALEHARDVERGVAEAAVDETRVQQGSHANRAGRDSGA
jgi:hypothetical protein